MYIFYNGDIIDNVGLNIGYNNRAFMYGDGVFETIIFKKLEIKYERYHKERLIAGMEALNLEFSGHLSIDTVFSSINALVLKTGYPTARIRLQVWRADGGLYTPKTNDCNVLATCTPEPIQGESKEKVSFSNTVKLSKTSWSAFKTISAMPYVQAGIEKTKRNLDDLILLDQQGHISECTSSNIFWKTEDTYLTPSLETGCINGIMRRHIIDQLYKHNIKIQVGEFLKEELLDAQEVFISNVSGLKPILFIDEKPYNNSLSITPILEL